MRSETLSVCGLGPASCRHHSQTSAFDAEAQKHFIAACSDTSLLFGIFEAGVCSSQDLWSVKANTVILSADLRSSKSYCQMGFPLSSCPHWGCLKFVRRNEPIALLTLATFGFSPRVALVLGQVGI